MTIITISGTPGSGKTTAGKRIAKRLGYKFYSIGDLRGKMALKMGITIEELNKMGDTDKELEKKFDDYQRLLGEKEDNLVIEGRVSFHFIPQSIKIFLTANLNEGAKRIFKDPRKDEAKKETLKEVKTSIQKRIKGDTQKYLKHYGIDYTKRNNYNFIVDTTNLTIDETVNTILEKIK